MRESEQDVAGEQAAGADWAGMQRWLTGEIASARPGLIIQMGPLGLDPDATFVPSAEVHALIGATTLVRLSTTWMHAPVLAGYSVPRLALDRWHHDRRFADCTHGYLMTRSPALAAAVCVNWFAVRCAFAHPDAVGYSTRGLIGGPPDLSPNSPSQG